MSAENISKTKPSLTKEQMAVLGRCRFSVSLVGGRRIIQGTTEDTKSVFFATGPNINGIECVVDGGRVTSAEAERLYEKYSPIAFFQNLQAS